MTAEKKLVCPACGSASIERVEKESTDQLTMGPKFSFKEIYFKCHACESEIDILHETDSNYLQAKKAAKDRAMKEMIESLNKSGISMSYLEWVFELPFRTLTRWKKGDYSAASLALLRIVKTFPWITTIAEQHFSPSQTQAILLQESAKVRSSAPIEVMGENVGTTGVIPVISTKPLLVELSNQPAGG